MFHPLGISARVLCLNTLQNPPAQIPRLQFRSLLRVAPQNCYLQTQRCFSLESTSGSHQESDFKVSREQHHTQSQSAPQPSTTSSGSTAAASPQTTGTASPVEKNLNAAHKSDGSSRKELHPKDQASPSVTASAKVKSNQHARVSPPASAHGRPIEYYYGEHEGKFRSVIENRIVFWSIAGLFAFWLSRRMFPSYKRPEMPIGEAEEYDKKGRKIPSRARIEQIAKGDA